MRSSRLCTVASRNSLSDISNSIKPSQVSSYKKKNTPSRDDAILDRLLVTHTHLTNLLTEIDKLVVCAFENETASQIGNGDIVLLEDCLSSMCSSLKPWVARFNEARADPSIGYNNQLGQSTGKALADAFEECPPLSSKDFAGSLIVSPSPLVSSRSDACSIGCGIFFVLTPLPKSKSGPFSKKQSLPSTSCHNAGPLTTTAHVHDEPLKMGGAVQKSTVIINRAAEEEASTESPLNFPDVKSRNCSKIALTPCLKPSWRSSILLDLDSKAFHKEKASKKSAHFSPAKDKRWDIVESLEWFLSPPKTCVPLEPPNLSAMRDGRMVNIMDSTPMLKGVESTAQKPRKGETTLKRELWTKFEAASGPSMHPRTSISQIMTNKGFLDMLEEVSSDPPCLDQ